MGSSPRQNNSLISAYPKRIADKHTRALIAAMHRQGMETKELADLISVDVRTVQSWREGNMPSGQNLISLMAALGSEYTNNVLAISGYSGAYLVDGDQVCGRELHTLIARLNHVLTKSFQDGRLDHQEVAEIQQEVLPVIAACTAFIARGCKGH